MLVRRWRWVAGALGAVLMAVTLWTLASDDGATSDRAGDRRDRTTTTSEAGATTSPELSGRTEEATGAVDGGAGTSSPRAAETTNDADGARPPSTTVPATDPSGKRWITIGSADGVGPGRSKPFMLEGIDTRLVYSSDARSFAVFLVDEVQGREATAGFAELDCDAPCRGEMLLTIPAGRYHLEVETAGGRYVVSVDEYRRPS